MYPQFILYTNIQYWCIDGKNRIYVARLRNGGKDELLASLSIVSCRVTQILYLPSMHQYCIYPAIQFAKINVIQSNNNNKKDNGNPIDTSIVFPVADVA